MQPFFIGTALKVGWLNDAKPGRAPRHRTRDQKLYLKPPVMWRSTMGSP
jgi:hypothetical protein